MQMAGTTHQSRAEVVDMNDSPKTTFCLRKAFAEKELAAAVEAVFNKYSLPYFSRVDILRAILTEEQRKAYDELANDAEGMRSALEEFYSKKIYDLELSSAKEKQELIEAFETGRLESEESENTKGVNNV